MRRLRIVVLFVLCAAFACNARDRPAPAKEPVPSAPPPGAVAPSPPAVDETTALLLMATGRDQAQALARFRGTRVEPVSGPQSLLKIDPPLRTAHAVAGPPRTATLSGSVRIQCEDDVFVHAPGLDDARAFYVAARRPVHPRPVSELKMADEARDRVASALGLKGRDTLVIDEASTADLDGDGKGEMIVVASSEMRDEADLDHSVLLIAPSIGEPAMVGYRRAIDGKDDAHLVQLQGIADVNGDGRMEVLALHTAPWIHHHRLVVYAWMNAKLVPLIEHVWAERECHPDDDWPTSTP
jgi:hypothetical protein